MNLIIPHWNGIFFKIPLLQKIYPRVEALDAAQSEHTSEPVLDRANLKQNRPYSFIQSQLVLFQSRKKWGLLYSLATVAGIFSVPGIISALGAEENLLVLLQKVVSLPIISLLVATGMYILNDLVDADLDRANRKNRPIPSGLVSKTQALTFVVATNGLAVLLSIITQNAASVLIIVPMLLLGALYSTPRVALMNRFVIKTLSIALFYVLCVLLGITSSYGIDLAAAAPAAPLHAMIMLGIMIFISSTLNDLGDVEGDRAAGRRTIPIVMGKATTIKFLTVLAALMIIISWTLYGTLSPLTLAFTTFFAVVLTIRLQKMKDGLKKINMQLMREQHRKIFPMHVILQMILAIGTAISFI